jgi:hypothetical protein
MVGILITLSLPSMLIMTISDPSLRRCLIASHPSASMPPPLCSLLVLVFYLYIYVFILVFSILFSISYFF